MFGRWVAPIGILWFQWVLSAFVFEKRLPDPLRFSPSVLLVVALLGLPCASVFIFFAIRWVDRRTFLQNRVSDLIVLWLITFLFLSHALVLSVVVGLRSSLHPGLAQASGGFLIGLALLLPKLPLGSPLGLYTHVSVHTSAAWQRRHRYLAYGLGVSGVGLLFSFLMPASLFFALALLPAVGAGVYAIQDGKNVQ